MTALLATVLLLVNVTVAVSLIQTNLSGSVAYVAVPGAFIAIALVAPVIVFRRSTKRRCSVAVGIRRAAFTSIALSVLVLPFSIGSMSM